MLVYKYVSPEAGIKTIKNGHIRFSQADALNDPFEIYPNFDTYRKSLKEAIHEELKNNSIEMDIIERESKIQKDVDIIIENRFNHIRKEGLVLSLTKKRNNLVMWSHYTNAHRGFVIGFDSDNSFFHEVTPQRNTTPLTPVKYIEERVSVPSFKAKIITSKEYMEFFLTKSIHWKYEEELRMIVTPMDENIIEEKDGNELDIYVFDFPPECIKEIIFGYLSTTELKRRISEIVASCYPHVELFEAQPSETDFDLNIKPYRVS